MILRLKRARNPDAVGLATIHAFVERMRARGVRVLLCGVRPRLARKLADAGVIEHDGDPVFIEDGAEVSSTIRAIEHAYRLIDDPCPGCRRGSPDAGAGPLHLQV